MGPNIQMQKGVGICVASTVHAMGSRAAPYATPLIVLAIFLGFLALRLPLRAEFLINWDAVNYALGANFFSIENHQPHPPGYIGYIALGWLLNHLTGEANASFTLLSAISGAAAPAALFLLSSYFMSRRYAVVTAVLFGLSPLVWYYSEVALSYSVEMALSLFFLWAGYKARTNLSMRHLLAATILIVVLGSVRQSGALFLMPLWLYMAWPFRWRFRLQAVTLLVVGNLAWLIPLIWLAGDPLAYIRASAGLASLAVAPTSVFALNPMGWVQNIAYIAGGIFLGVNVGVIIVALGHWSHSRPLANLTTCDRMFFIIWAGPSLATYTLLHTGQLGYLLLVLPAGFLWVGLSLSAMVGKGHMKRPVPAVNWKSGSAYRRAVVAASLVIILLATNVMGSLYGLKMVYAVASPEQENVVHDAANDFFDSVPHFSMDIVEESEGLAERARQFDVKTNDEHWDRLTNLIDVFDPDTTAVLTLPNGAGSFRHLTYYLPEYRVYGLGEDLDETFGHMFTAHNGTSDYSVEGLEEASRFLDLPDEIRRLVIPDKDIMNRFAEDTDGVVLELVNGREVFVIPVPDGAALRFVEEGEEGPRIRLDYPPGARRNDGAGDSGDLPNGIGGS